MKDSTIAGFLLNRPLYTALKHVNNAVLAEPAAVPASGVMHEHTRLWPLVSGRTGTIQDCEEL